MAEWTDGAGAGALAVHASAHTDRGAVRGINEDSHLAAHPVFVVADGMGGHAHGDRASATATAVFADLAGSPALRPAQVLDAVQRANREVRTISHEDGDTRGTSGTTLAGLALVRVGPNGTPHWMIVNVGDSRVYRWDGRALAQVSVDHSVVQELVDGGSISRMAALTHPARNVVTRALGAADHADADVWLVPAAGAQTFVLCSDGLTRELTDDEIARIIAFHGTLEHDSAPWSPSLAERLVGAAVAAGGADNVTVVVVESAMAGAGAYAEATGERGAMSASLEDTLPRGPR